jgi:hypothetical protein
MPTLRRILKYTPAVVMGLLVVAWVVNDFRGVGYSNKAWTWEAGEGAGDALMESFWDDCGSGPTIDSPMKVNLTEARSIWHGLRGVHGNFFGLTDGEGHTIQFYFDADLPDHVDDASHLKIVLVDFPVPIRNGSYTMHMTTGEVDGLIERAFEVGADYRRFGTGLTFSSW